VKRLKIPIGEVLASPFCRTMETARLAFGKATATNDVRGGPVEAARYEPLRKLLSSPVPESMLAPAWFYFPRMIDSASVVLRERIDAADRPTFELLNHSLLVKQAATLGERRAA
jgi:hypothetical protein